MLLKKNNLTIKTTGKQTLSFPMYTGIDPAEYISLYSVVETYINNWVIIETQYAPKDLLTNNTFLGILKTLNLKAVFSTESTANHDMLRNLLSNNFTNRTVGRIIDLEIKLNYSIPHEFIQTIKARIYEAVKSYLSYGLGTEEQFGDFITLYPFYWLLFIIQSVLIENKK